MAWPHGPQVLGIFTLLLDQSTWRLIGLSNHFSSCLSKKPVIGAAYVRPGQGTSEDCNIITFALKKKPINIKSVTEPPNQAQLCWLCGRQKNVQEQLCAHVPNIATVSGTSNRPESQSGNFD